MVLRIVWHAELVIINIMKGVKVVSSVLVRQLPQMKPQNPLTNVAVSLKRCTVLLQTMRNELQARVNGPKALH